MKTLLTIQILLLSLILFGTDAVAQISITSSDVSAINAVGNVLINHFDSLTTSLDIGSAGASSWDFSALNSQYTNTFTSVLPSSTPFISDFPTANVVFSFKEIIDVDTALGWQYYIQNPGDYSMDGIALRSSLWTNDGVAVSTATFVQSFPLVLNDGNNGMIIAWPDLRNDLSGQRHDIYAQRVNNNGTLGGVTGVNENDHFLSSTFTLGQNYPNPFNPSTKISWQSPVNSHQALKVYNVLGNEVALLVNKEEPAGIYEVEFNASQLSSGIYFYKLQAGSFVETKKMILLK